MHPLHGWMDGWTDGRSDRRTRGGQPSAPFISEWSHLREYALPDSRERARDLGCRERRLYNDFGFEPEPYTKQKPCGDVNSNIVRSLTSRSVRATKAAAGRSAADCHADGLA